MYTYAGPTVHVEPMLRFMSHICRLGAATGLPIGICWNDTPRDVRYSPRSWERFLTRVRDGVVQTCLVVQFARPGMTMVSFSGSTLSPFSMDAFFVPAGGIPPDTRNSAFQLARARKTDRYPSALHLKLDTAAFQGLVDRGLQELLAEFDDLVTAAAAACACVEAGVMHPDFGTLPSGPELLDDRTLLENLDRRIPGIFWRIYLGPQHIARLGGKGHVLRTFADCRILDLSSGQEDRACIQLTENIGALDDEVANRHRPLFRAVLEKE